MIITENLKKELEKRETQLYREKREGRDRTFTNNTLRMKIAKAKTALAGDDITLQMEVLEELRDLP